jgi:hypothetical protein
MDPILGTIIVGSLIGLAAVVIIIKKKKSSDSDNVPTVRIGTPPTPEQEQIAKDVLKKMRGPG